MLLLFIGSSFLVTGQAQQKYDEFIAKAEEFYKEKAVQGVFSKLQMGF